MYNCNTFSNWRNQVHYCERLIIGMNVSRIDITFNNVLSYLVGFHWLEYGSKARVAAMIMSIAKNGRPDFSFLFDDD